MGADWRAPLARTLTEWNGLRRLRKQFFFEKKNQKAFVPCRVLAERAAPNGQKLFASFSRKRRPFFLYCEEIACTLANGTDTPPSCSVSPLAPFVSPVAVPTTLNGTAVAVAPLVPVSSATP